MGKKSSLLIDTKDVLLLLMPLAVLIGDREAIALQQIHYWLELNEEAEKGDTHFFDGKWWAYNTWDGWETKNFPCWSVATIQRVFESLKNKGLILLRLHEQPKKGQWVTICYDALNALQSAKHERKKRESKRVIRKKTDPSQIDQGSQFDYPDPSQIDYPTGTPETTYPETISKNTPTQNLDAKKRSAPAAAKPPQQSQAHVAPVVAADAEETFFDEIVDTSESPPDSPFDQIKRGAPEAEEKSIEISPLGQFIKEQVPRPRSLSKQCRKKLSESVPDSDGKTSHPSPDVLYIENPRFKEYVQVTIRNAGNDSDYNKIVNFIRNYGHVKHGWLAFKGSTRPHIESEEINELQAKLNTAYVEGNNEEAERLYDLIHAKQQPA